MFLYLIYQNYIFKNNVISKEFTKKLKLSDIVIHLAAQTDATKKFGTSSINL